jgi:hypothetical protein
MFYLIYWNVFDDEIPSLSRLPQIIRVVAKVYETLHSLLSHFMLNFKIVRTKDFSDNRNTGIAPTRLCAQERFRNRLLKKSLYIFTPNLYSSFFSDASKRH